MIFSGLFSPVAFVVISWILFCFLFVGLLKISVVNRSLSKEIVIPEKLILWGGSFLFFVYFIVLNFFAIHSLSFWDRDFASNVQWVWKLSEGVYAADTIFHRFYLADHWSPILKVLSMGYRLFPDPLYFPVMVILSFLLGAALIYFIAKQKLKNRFLALAVWVALVANPYVHLALVGFANVDVYSFLFITLSMWFYFNKRLLPYAICAFIAWNCKEDVALYYVGIGVWMAVANKDRRVGLLTVLFSLISFYLITFVAMPFMNEGKPVHNFIRYFSQFGGNMKEIASFLLSNPLAGMKFVLRPDAIVASVLLLGTVFGIPLLGGGILILLVLPLAVKLLAAKAYMVAMAVHHIWHPLFFLFLAFIWGIHNFLRVKLGSLNQNAFLSANVMGCLLIVFSLLMVPLYPKVLDHSRFSGQFFQNPIHGQWGNFRLSGKADVLRQAVKEIPPQARLFADINILSYTPNRMVLNEINDYHGHVGSGGRWGVQSILDVLSKSDYCLFDFESRRNETVLLWTKPLIRLLLRQLPGWELVFQQDGVEVYKNRKYQPLGANHKTMTVLSSDVGK